MGGVKKRGMRIEERKEETGKKKKTKGGKGRTRTKRERNN